MIIKSGAKSHYTSNEPPSMTCRIEFEEICSVCDKEIPEGALVLRKVETNNIICLLCVIDIAEIQL